MVLAFCFIGLLKALGLGRTVSAFVFSLGFPLRIIASVRIESGVRFNDYLLKVRGGEQGWNCRVPDVRESNHSV